MCKASDVADFRAENNVVAEEIIREYSTSLLSLKSLCPSSIPESMITGRFDPQSGRYILPADDEDEGYYDF